MRGFAASELIDEAAISRYTICAIGSGDTYPARQPVKLAADAAIVGERIALFFT